MFRRNDKEQFCQGKGKLRKISIKIRHKSFMHANERLSYETEVYFSANATEDPMKQSEELTREIA